MDDERFRFGIVPCQLCHEGDMTVLPPDDPPCPQHRYSAWVKAGPPHDGQLFHFNLITQTHEPGADVLARLRREGSRTHAATQARRCQRVRHAERCRPFVMEARDQGLGVRGAQRLLERAGIPSPSGRQTWSVASVWRVIKALGVQLGRRR